MDVIEAIKQRKSIRAFKPDPVPLDILKKILEQALRAPSWANTQPWEFAIVTGPKLAEIQKAFVENREAEAHSDVTRPYEFPEPYSSRRRSAAVRTDPAARAAEAARQLRNVKHYGAPAVIYLLVGRSFYYQTKGINVWPLYDCGSVVQNIMLLATNYGLGTIAQARAVVYPDIIRKVLGIPESKLIALGIAIGYPDWTDSINQGWTVREPLDKVVTWYGFD